MKNPRNPHKHLVSEDFLWQGHKGSNSGHAVLETQTQFQKNEYSCGFRDFFQKVTPSLTPTFIVSPHHLR
nr:MAG TPA: hypothetical protein [Caudoviricetes sp.]